MDMAFIGGLIGGLWIRECWDQLVHKGSLICIGIGLDWELVYMGLEQSLPKALGAVLDSL